MRSVRIVNETGLSNDTKVIDAKTGIELQTFCTEIDLRFRPCEPVEARLEIGMIEATFNGKAGFYTHDPANGGMKRVAKIIFEDGSVFEA
ncbi:hypothetical protein [Microvirga massiliensis]|uniref:hypothetical protein n=1 Tax=Microvirga massiliensis TaxID=1033741 RepID=UPI00062B58CB|nr:hypothetical protein [Microvirga massiliensis]